MTYVDVLHPQREQIRTTNDLCDSADLQKSELNQNPSRSARVLRDARKHIQGSQGRTTINLQVSISSTLAGEVCSTVRGIGGDSNTAAGHPVGVTPWPADAIDLGERHGHSPSPAPEVRAALTHEVERDSHPPSTLPHCCQLLSTDLEMSSLRPGHQVQARSLLTVHGRVSGSEHE